MCIKAIPCVGQLTAVNTPLETCCVIPIHADEFGSSVPESEDYAHVAMHVSQRN